MELEKNPKTRIIGKVLLKIEDRISGVSFPKMRRARQISSCHCGPAVLESLFSFVGIKVSQKAMVASLRAQEKIKKYGLGPKEMVKAASIYGKDKTIFWRKSNASVSDLDQIINKYKFPVGVEWQGVFYEFDDGDSGHYSIVTKIERKNDHLRMADPYSEFVGVDRKFKIKDFEKRWWDTNRVGKKDVLDKKVMFIVTPKNETWPKKLGMKKS